MHKNARGQLQSKSGNVLVHHLCSLPSSDMVIVDPRFGNQTWLAGKSTEVYSWENQRTKWGFVQQDMFEDTGGQVWLVNVGYISH